MVIVVLNVGKIFHFKSKNGEIKKNVYAKGDNGRVRTNGENHDFFSSKQVQTRPLSHMIMFKAFYPS